MKKILFLFLLSLTSFAQGMFTVGADSNGSATTIDVSNRVAGKLNPYAKEFQFKGFVSPTLRYFPGDLDLGLPIQVKKVENWIREEEPLYSDLSEKYKKIHPAFCGKIYDEYTDSCDYYLGLKIAQSRLKRIGDENGIMQEGSKYRRFPWPSDEVDEYPKSKVPFENPVQAKERKKLEKKARLAKEKEDDRTRGANLKAHELKFTPVLALLAARFKPVVKPAEASVSVVQSEVSAAHNLSKMNTLSVSLAAVVASQGAKQETKATLPKKDAQKDKTTFSAQAKVGESNVQFSIKGGQGKKGKGGKVVRKSLSGDVDDAFFAEQEKLNKTLPKFVDEKAAREEKITENLVILLNGISDVSMPWNSLRANFYTKNLQEIIANKEDFKTYLPLLKKNPSVIAAYKQALDVVTDAKDLFDKHYENDRQVQMERSIGLISPFDKLLKELLNLRKSKK